MKTFLVVGLGRFGSAVARQLYELGKDVILIEEDAELLQRMASYATYAVVGDARDEEVLKALGVNQCDCAIVAIGGDLAASILVTLNLKELGVPRVICKAPNEQHKRALEKVGADRVVIPEREMGVKLAQNLASSSVLDYIELSKDCGISEIRVPRSWQGKTILELNVRAKYGVNIIAMRHGESQQITVALDPNCVLNEEDVLVILGNTDQLRNVQIL